VRGAAAALISQFWRFGQPGVIDPGLARRASGRGGLSPADGWGRP